MSAKFKTEPAPACTPAGPAPAPIPPWNFAGYRAFLNAAGDRLGLAPSLTARAATSGPLVCLGRVLSGLSSMVQRVCPQRPFRPDERESIRATLTQVEEVRWHYRILADAAVAMIDDAH